MVAHARSPAAREAEAGELLEPRRWRWQWAEIAPLHSSLGDKKRLHQKKEKKRKEKREIFNLEHCAQETFFLILNFSERALIVKVKIRNSAGVRNKHQVWQHQQHEQALEIECSKVLRYTESDIIFENKIF